MSLAHGLRSVFPPALAFTCALSAFIPWPELRAQAGGAQQSGRAPTPTDTAVEAPLADYNHCDIAPGADLESALQTFRALKQRQAQAWAQAASPLDGESGVEPFQIDTGSPDRWGTPGAYGNPEVITWSLASDDAWYFPPVGTTPGIKNQLFSWMNARFNNNQSLWISKIEEGFQRWSELTGITFVRVQYQGNEWDDGADYGVAGAPGLRGDIRIFVSFIDGPATPGGAGPILAATEPPAGIPPGALGASPGEITFDLEAWNTTPWLPTYGFQRTIHHEIGHAIGLAHTCPAQSNTKLMQPFASTPFGTPQHDDVRGAQALYGDPLEPNDTRAQASFFQIFPPGFPAHCVPATWPWPDSIVFPGGILSIDNGTDQDWFEFGLLAGANMDVEVRPIGGVYQDWAVDSTFQCPSMGGTVNSAAVTPLHVQIWRSIDANDDVIVAETSALAGHSAMLTGVKLKYPGRYRIRVSSATFVPQPKQSQQYELEVTWTPFACSGSVYCNDLDPQNGSEVCDPAGGCIFQYIDDDYNFDSVPDATQTSWLLDLDGSGHPDVGETAYTGNGQPRTRVRGQDECGDSQPIAAGIDYAYMTYYATPDPGILADSKDEAGVWFRYTPQTNGVVSVQVRSHVEFATELYVSPVSPAGACSNSGSTFGASQIEWSPYGEPIGQLAEITFEAQANVEHRIRVSGNTSNVYLGVGDFTIRVEGPDDVTHDCDKNGTLDSYQGAPDYNQNGIIDSCELVGATNHCLLSENAAGPGSLISAAGSLKAADKDLVLIAEGATPGANGMFIASTSRLATPQEGKVCLAGPILRLGAVQVADDGSAELRLDFAQYNGLIASGTTWNFQFWFRDTAGPWPWNTNVSDAIELKFY